MPATYTLDNKIEALNLLDRHDGDFKLVQSILKIPLKLLRDWRANHVKLRHKHEDRQYSYFATIKLELMEDMWETSRDIMKKIKSGNHEGNSLSQLAYTLSTLLHHANKLEDNFEDLAPQGQNEAEEPNRIQFVSEDVAGDAPPPGAAATPQNPVPPQSIGARAALKRMAVGANQDPESDPLGAQTLLAGLPHDEDGESKPAQSDKRPKAPRKRRHRAILAGSDKRRKAQKRRRHKTKPKAR